jgi:type IV pilus assembly protein PilB
MAVRIGELLLKERRITPDQLQEALTYQRVQGGKLGSALVKLGFVRDEDITALLSKQYGVPSINLSQFEIDPAVIKLVPYETAHKYQIIPLSRTGATLTIAMTDPTNVFAMDDIKFMTGYNVEPVVASETAVQEAIHKYYAGAIRDGTPTSALEMASRVLEEMPGTQEDEVEVIEDLEEISVEALMRQGEEAPVIRLVNVLLMSAIQKGASDIHIEPYEKEYRVRYRIDGVLYSIMNPSLKLRDAIASRVKIMARLDIAEKRLPQDGRIKIRYKDQGRSKEIDFRVSVLPTLFGEKIVLRLLDREKLMLDMTRLGFEPDSLARYEAAIQKPWGMVLVTGPTGSGKTTTLYAALSAINTIDRKIITIEDPIEYHLGGINQIQVNTKAGLTFAAGLRAILRHDPDVVLIGEIRDKETAEIAVQASLTGHLVFSTLHTNDAPSAATRLIDMGLEPYLVASSLEIVLAQRLVRVICPKCKTQIPEADVQRLRAEFGAVVPPVMYRGAGCRNCQGTGYRGRTGIFELMVVTDEIREMVLNRAPAPQVRKKAVEQGMISLRGDGWRVIREGKTSPEEVLRATKDEITSGAEAADRAMGIIPGAAEPDEAVVAEAR